MQTNQKPIPCFKRGCPVTLLEMPDGHTSKDYPLTVGNTYEFVDWSGSNIVITTDVPGETASIHYSRVEYDSCEY